MAEQSGNGDKKPVDRATLRAAKLRENLHKRKSQRRARTNGALAREKQQDQHKDDT